MELKFTIPGRMRGKGRTRFVVRKKQGGGAFPQPIPDQDTAIMETVVRDYAHKAMQAATASSVSRKLLEGPIHLQIVMVLTPPASWSKKRLAAAFWATGRPDLDNVVKLIGDALNGHVWKDDAQLSKLTVERTYRQGEQERTSITITELAPPAETLL